MTNAPRWLSIMIVALLLGMAILMRNLQGYESLWVDEGWSIGAAQQTTLADVTTFVANDVHPPLYFQLLHLWEAVAGESILALRYSSVLIVLLAAALVYWLGRALHTPFTGALAAGLFILNDLVQVLGREVRQYPLSQLMVLLTIAAYWRFWQRPTRIRGAVFVLSSAALLYTHYWGGFLLVACVLHLLLTRPHQLRAFVIACAGIGLLFLPWLPVVLEQIGGEAQGGLEHALPANRQGFDILTFQLFGRPEIFWLILLVVGFFSVLRGRNGTRALYARNPALLPALAVIIPVATSFAINFAFPTLSYRALSMVIPFAMLLVALAVAGFRPYERAVMSLIVVALSLSLTAAEPAIRLPWPQIATFITQHNASTDPVLIETDFDTFAFNYYLRQANTEQERVFTEVRRRRKFETLEGFLNDLDQRLEDESGLWIVRFSSDYDVLPYLENQGWTQTASVFPETELGVPVELWRYDRVPPSEVESFGDVLMLKDARVSTQPSGVTVTSLWSAQADTETDYTMSAFLLDEAGTLVAQHDSYPLDGVLPTSAWEPGRTYFDGRFIPTSGLASGTYQVALKVYHFTDATFTQTAALTPQSCAEQNCEYIILDTISLGA
jgi:hypothetical protein